MVAQCPVTQAQRTGRPAASSETAFSKEIPVKQFALIAAIPVIAVVTLIGPIPARAGDGGTFAAGVVGEFVGGLALGSALSPRPYSYTPAHCYWTHGRPYWDALRGVWISPRVRVCQ